MILNSDTDEIPPPSNISLDINTRTLDWNHAFQPDLPLGFDITLEHNLTYYVTVRDRDSEGNGESLTSHETSLDISHVLDYCRRQEFTVQTVVNDIYHSQSSFFITNPSGESLSIITSN